MSGRVHSGSDWTVEILGELIHVRERSCTVFIIVFPCLLSSLEVRRRTLHSEDVRGVNPCEESEVQRLVPVLGAPHVGRTQPEGLGLGPVWSTLIGRAPTLLRSHWSRASPAILCHKESARSKQNNTQWGYFAFQSP